MGRALGFLGFVIAIWIALEFYTNGLEGAFGGAFSDAERSSAALRTERAADAFQRSYDESLARVDRQLGE
jgi:hypothetical protein